MAFSPSVPKQAFTGFARPIDQTNPLNATWFLIRQALGSVFTAALVQVKGVNAGAGTVDLQILVNQVDGEGNSQPHGTIYGVGYGQLRGGANAIILTPVAGDIGIAVFAMRDSSAARSTRAPANPGSARRFDPADALYICGLAGGAEPTQYVEFTEDSINVKATLEVKLEAPTIRLKGTVVEGP